MEMKKAKYFVWRFFEALILLYAFLLFVTTAVSIYTGHWFLPASVLVLGMMHRRLFVLLYHALKDIKNKRTSRIEIPFCDVCRDHTHSLDHMRKMERVDKYAVYNDADGVWYFTVPCDKRDQPEYRRACSSMHGHGFRITYLESSHIIIGIVPSDRLSKRVEYGYHLSSVRPVLDLYALPSQSDCRQDRRSGMNRKKK